LAIFFVYHWHARYRMLISRWRSIQKAKMGILFVLRSVATASIYTVLLHL
jgi:hypothetical protein